MESTTITLLIIAGTLILLLIIFYLSYIAEKKRREALQETASVMGMSFTPKDDGSLLSGLEGFHVFSQGHSRRITNLIEGTARQARVAIFDYRYTTGGGKHSHTWNQTVIHFQLEQELPSFSLRPQNVFDTIGGWLGQQDINFEQFPEFSKKYLLRGEDETAIRGLFGLSAATYYEQKEGLCTEARGNRLLVYRPNQRVSPEDIRTFLDEGQNVLALFQRPW